MTRIFGWLGKLSCGLFLALAIVSCKQEQEVKTLHLAHGLSIDHAVHKAMEHMAERLRVYSNGAMDIEIYPSGQLGSERELIELLQIGSLAMTKVSSSPLESFVPEMKVFSIPYVFRDQAHVWAVLNSSIGKGLLEKPVSVRLRGLTYYDAGSRSFYSNDRLIESPSDLKGLKIRVQSSQTSMQMIDHFGGSATPIAWGELYTALQQGVVNGAENNPPSFYLSRHYETSKFYSLNEHTSVPDILLVSEHVWQSMSSQQRDWLQQAADDSSVFQRTLWAAATQEALDAVRAAGVEVITPDKTPFRNAVKSMKTAYDGTPIGDMIKAIEGTE